MNVRNRIGNKWSVNEVLSLQREFELCGLDIDQIAEKHGRTSSAIMFKLNQEGLAYYNVSLKETITDRRSNKVFASETDASDVTNEDSLSKQVQKMNDELYEIRNMLTILTSHLVV